MAAADGNRIIRNAPYRVTGRIIATTTLAPITGGLTAMDAEVDLDAAGFVDIAAAEAEIGTSGHFTCDLAVAETTGNTVEFRMSASNANAVPYYERLVFEPALDSGVAQASTAQRIRLRAAASSTDNIYRGATIEIVRGTGAGQVRTIVYYEGATNKDAFVDRLWTTTPDTTSVYIIHPRVEAYADTYIYGYISDASPTTTDFDGASGISLSSIDDTYNQALMVGTGGSIRGHTNRITDYTGGSRNFAFATAWPVTPANGDSFRILSIAR